MHDIIVQLRNHIYTLQDKGLFMEESTPSSPSRYLLVTNYDFAGTLPEQLRRQINTIWIAYVYFTILQYDKYPDAQYFFILIDQMKPNEPISVPVIIDNDDD